VATEFHLARDAAILIIFIPPSALQPLRTGVTVMTKWTTLLAFAFLFADPCFAQTINKADMLEMTRQTCSAQFLQDKPFIDLLLIGGGRLPEFCECLAVRFAAQVDDADFANAKAIATKWADSKNICLAISLKTKS
jgi:hypothetical protein